MHLLKFFFSKAFWINLLIAIVLIAIGFWFLLGWLDDYTRHGDSMTLKDYKQTALEDLDEVFKNDHLRYAIIDTVYDDDSPKGCVVDQDPKPFSKVKENRTIYLTINSLSTIKVEMPDLTSQSPKIAIKHLNVSGLQLDSIWYVPSRYNGLVLDQLHKGEHIEAGKKIKKGEKIVLKVGDSSLEGDKISLPNLVGATFKEAQKLAELSDIRVNPICPECMNDDQIASAKVTRQDPPYELDKKIFSGELIDLFLTPDTLKND